MNHETLQALYALDVAEVGEDEAAKRWEYWSGTYWRYNERFSKIIVKPSWCEDVQYRRKPGIPWPKVMLPIIAVTGDGAGHIVCVSEQDEEGRILKIIAESAPFDTKQEWPADAPEWANAVLITKHYYIDVNNVSKMCGASNNQVIIERPKPAVKKIDWSKCSTKIWRLIATITGEDGYGSAVEEPTKIPTDWIAWNCDEHTRGNPLPDGLVVEWFYIGSAFLKTRLDCKQEEIAWEDVTRFRIAGIQEGWK